MNIFKLIWYRTYQIVFKGALRILKFPRPKLLNGKGSIEKLAKEIENDELKTVLIVTDENLRNLGLLNGLFEALKAKNIEYAVFDGVQPNPSIQNVEDAYKKYLDKKCEGIIAFGGGSPMDCAKITAARVVKPNKSVIKMRGMFKILKKLPPFYAVPTTAGTGSETTIVAVILNQDEHEKFAIIDFNLTADIAVLDPALMVGLPAHITSTTGMDALTHAIEAYIGIHKTKFTDSNAEKATKLIFENIEKAYSTGAEDLEIRNNMSLASFYAGLSFTRASVGYVHAIAHNLGGFYGVPHGLANAIILPYVLDAFGEKIHKKLANLAVATGLGTKNESETELAEKFKAKVKDLNKNMAIPNFIKELKAVDIPLLSKRAAKEANPQYPVPKIFDKEKLAEIMYELIEK